MLTNEQLYVESLNGKKNSRQIWFFSAWCAEMPMFFSQIQGLHFVGARWGVIMHRLVDLGPWSFCRLVCAALHFVGMFVVSNAGRFAPMKKTSRCGEGGFVRLQAKLLAKEKLECEGCKSMLANHKFSHEDLKEATEQVLAGQRDPKDRFKEAVDNEGKEPTISKKRKGARKNQKGDEQDGEESEDNGPEACMKFLKQFEPWIQLLPAGSFGKKQPYRCIACTSRSQPQGRVGDLVEMRLGSVKHFLTQHTGCPTHDRNVKKMQRVELVKEKQKVDCQGLSIEDAETAGRLWVYRNEFALWASVANFKSCARHTYFHDANAGTWIVKSSDCEKLTLESEEMERHVCSACLALGAAHSVSWFWIRCRFGRCRFVIALVCPSHFVSFCTIFVKERYFVGTIYVEYFLLEVI